LNAMTIADNNPPAKRRKLDVDQPEEALAATEHRNEDSLYKGLERSISPPMSRRRSPVAPNHAPEPTWGFDDVLKETLTPATLDSDAPQDGASERDGLGKRSTDYLSSPFQLTHIQDLAPHQNVDAVRLKDILGDPMIKECWNFNFLFDIDFVM
jgi:tyrosyl-DNA phosphodiesterase-1